MSSWEKMLQQMKYENPEKYRVEQLKRNWYNDPFWDIEDTEGFENHYIELKAFRIGCECDWKQNQDTLTENKAKELNCSLELADYILELEWKIVVLNDKLSNFMTTLGY